MIDVKNGFAAPDRQSSHIRRKKSLISIE